MQGTKLVASSVFVKVCHKLPFSSSTTNQLSSAGRPALIDNGIENSSLLTFGHFVVQAGGIFSHSEKQATLFKLTSAWWYLPRWFRPKIHVRHCSFLRIARRIVDKLRTTFHPSNRWAPSYETPQRCQDCRSILQRNSNFIIFLVSYKYIV